MKIELALKQSKVTLIEKEILLADLLKKDRSFLHSHSDFDLNEKQTNDFEQRLIRRENHEPLAYILGYQEFYGRKFLVNKNVLIPRPETEEMVEKVLSFLASNQEPNDKTRSRNKLGRTKREKVTVIDIGTGSGCIAITLKLEDPALKVLATDVSKDALAVASKNAKLFKAEISFIESDLLEKLNQKVDIILANLPYIPTKNLEHLEPEVRDWEPRLALDSLESKTSYYERLFEQAKTKLKPDGVIFYEIDGDIFTKNYKELTF